MNSPTQQFSHTPGPWGQSRYHFPNRDVVQRTGSADNDAFPGARAICAVHANGKSFEEQNANACLIAASPDLLEFAQWAESRQPEMLKMIQANNFVFTDIGNEPGNWQYLAFTLYTELCELRSMAESAIAKATKGTTP